jgi:hypothetical protein
MQSTPKAHTRYKAWPQGYSVDKETSLDGFHEVLSYLRTAVAK